MKTMKRIQEDLKLKDDKIEPPDVYLGATLAKMTLETGKSCWTMSAEQYCKAAVANVEEELAKQGRRLPPKCVTPFSSNYAPWLEESPELKADGVQRFQELIGQLRWAIEIGRVDILLETSLLSSYLAMPRAGHLEQALHIFGYLKTHPKRQPHKHPPPPLTLRNRSLPTSTPTRCSSEIPSASKTQHRRTTRNAMRTVAFPK